MSALVSRPKAVTMNVRERAGDVLRPLNIHIAVVSVLGLVCLYLLVHMLLAWRSASSGNSEAVAQQQLALRTAEIQARPLQGLDAKLKDARLDAATFETERLPVSYSEVAAELGAVAKRNNVRLSAANYAQRPVVSGAEAGQLTEVQIDARLTGEYGGLVRFINGLERDRLFYMIGGITLTGQQTGVVNLRIRITTYLRGEGDAAEMARVQVAAPEDTAPAAAGSAARGAR